MALGEKSFLTIRAKLAMQKVISIKKYRTVYAYNYLVKKPSASFGSVPFYSFELLTINPAVPHRLKASLASRVSLTLLAADGQALRTPG